MPNQFTFNVLMRNTQLCINGLSNWKKRTIDVQWSPLVEPLECNLFIVLFEFNCFLMDKHFVMYQSALHRNVKMFLNFCFLSKHLSQVYDVIMLLYFVLHELYISQVHVPHFGLHDGIVHISWHFSKHKNKSQKNYDNSLLILHTRN